MSDLNILKNDELLPDFTNVNGFSLEDESLIFTAEFIGEEREFGNMKTLNLKSNGRNYVMQSCNYIGNNVRDIEIVYTVIPGKLAK